MNNSLPRLIDGMVATLRREVIPNTAGEYARGQAFGIVYVLESIKRRAAWSNAFLGEQLAALDELGRGLAALGSDLGCAPLPTLRPPLDLPSDAVLEARRDEGDREVCRLIDWLEANRGTLSTDVARRVDDAIGRYLARQLRHEIATSAKPMFAEISSGTEARA